MIQRTLGELILVETALADGLAARGDRRQSTRDRAAESGGERARRHAHGGKLSIETFNLDRVTRPTSTGGESAAGRIRRDRCSRYRHRHAARSAGASVRAVLHDQERRPGHRPRAYRRSTGSCASPVDKCASPRRMAQARRFVFICRPRDPMRKCPRTTASMRRRSPPSAKPFWYGRRSRCTRFTVETSARAWLRCARSARWRQRTECTAPDARRRHRSVVQRRGVARRR